MTGRPSIEASLLVLARRATLAPLETGACPSLQGIADAPIEPARTCRQTGDFDAWT
jgi:hypothetical protein